MIQRQPYSIPVSTPRSSANVCFLVSLLSMLTYSRANFIIVRFFFIQGHFIGSFLWSFYCWFPIIPSVSKVVWNTDSPPKLTVICKLSRPVTSWLPAQVDPASSLLSFQSHSPVSSVAWGQWFLIVVHHQNLLRCFTIHFPSPEVGPGNLHLNAPPPCNQLGLVYSINDAFLVLCNLVMAY